MSTGTLPRRQPRVWVDVSMYGLETELVPVHIQRVDGQTQIVCADCAHVLVQSVARELVYDTDWFDLFVDLAVHGDLTGCGLLKLEGRRG